VVRQILAVAFVALLGRPVQITQPQLGRFALFWGHVDPKNSNDLIACGESDNANNDHFSFAFASTDGGLTWRQTLADRSSRWVSEDSCAFGNDGRAYFATGSSYVHNGEPHHEYGVLHVYRSLDHGQTWQGPAVRGFADWTSIAVDQTNGARRNYVYVFGNATWVHRGTWWPYRPVLYTSRDNGGSLTGPVSVHPRGYKYLSAFAGGSTVLSDGTAVVVDAVQRSGGAVRGTLGRHSTIEMFASSDGGRTLETRALIADVHGAGAWPSAPVEDLSEGAHRGRIYVGWVETLPTKTRMMLGFSDDLGYHWKIREIAQGAPSGMEAACDPETSSPDLGVPKIAVNNQGVLGLAWSENEGHHLRFAYSRDGGRTFSSSVQLAGCAVRSNRYAGLEAVPFSEHWYAEALAVAHNKPEPIPDVNKLGISIRIDADFSDSPELATDSNGRFHAFWQQPGDGLSFWTRAIRIPIAPADPPSDPPRLTQISSLLSFDFTNLHYDDASKTVSADIKLINKGHQTIFTPVLLRGYSIHSDYGTASAANCTRWAGNGDPVWDVSSTIPRAGLAPDSESRPYRLVFRISHYRYVSQGDAVSLNVHAYGRLKRHH
jgi:hypothetical protein